MEAIINSPHLPTVYSTRWAPGRTPEAAGSAAPCPRSSIGLPRQPLKFASAIRAGRVLAPPILPAHSRNSNASRSPAKPASKSTSWRDAEHSAHKCPGYWHRPAAQLRSNFQSECCLMYPGAHNILRTSVNAAVAVLNLAQVFMHVT